MNLEPKMREQIRLCLLRCLDAGAPGAFAPSLLAAMLRGEGFNLKADTIAAELDYLRGKGLVEEARKTISPENVTWRITAEGRDTYAKIANE
jgi:hypothetical protein